jgi:hypothetical protein
LLPSALFELSILGIESDRLFEVVAARVDEDDGIMMSGSGSGSFAVRLHESWLPVASDRWLCKKWDYSDGIPMGYWRTWLEPVVNSLVWLRT